MQVRHSISRVRTAILATNFDRLYPECASVTLAPGASSSTITLTAHAKAGQTSGTNTSSVTAASANHANATTNTVTDYAQCACMFAGSSISKPCSVDRQYHDRQRHGSIYLTITNNDTGACASETFNLSEQTATARTLRRLYPECSLSDSCSGCNEQYNYPYSACKGRTDEWRKCIVYNRSEWEPCERDYE